MIPPEKNCMQVRKQQLEPDMEQWSSSKLEKKPVKAVHCSPAYLTLWRVHHVKCQAGWSTSWNRDCQETYQQPQMCRWPQSYGQKQRRTKEPFYKGKRGEWKSWLKTQHSKNKDYGIWFHHFMANRWENNRNSDRLYFWGAPKSLQMVTAAMKLKDSCSLEEKLWPT